MSENKFERLYLAIRNEDNNQDVYVEKCPLIQHQIDGIRFLYRALKKKKCGVVLNDPPCYGKRVQAALFISAVLPAMEKPVLVLCREGYEQRWLKNFQKWTSISEDDVEKNYPSSKKKVFIAELGSAIASARREWSILVVDHDVIPRDVKTMRADLRIWITSTDIKEDLTKFSTFFSWIRPKDKFVSDDFKADTSDIRDVITKAVMLDAFLEDYVLRRESEVVPFSRSQDAISRKNKDVTGEKIKRSKRKSVEKDKKLQSKVPKTVNNTREGFEMGDINEPLTRNVDIASKVLNWDTDTDSESDVNHKVNITNRKRDTYELNQSDDNIENINNDTANYNAATKRKVRIVVESDSDSENGDITTDNEVILNNDKNNYDLIKSIDDEMIVEDNSIKCVIPANEIDAENKFIIVNVPEEDDNKSEDLFSTNFTTNIKDFPITNEIKDSISTKPNILDTEKVYEITKLNQSELNEDKNKTEKPQQNVELSSFEMKMKLLEEQTLKKFKGSFLDGLF